MHVHGDSVAFNALRVQPQCTTISIALKIQSWRTLIQTENGMWKRTGKGTGGRGWS